MDTDTPCLSENFSPTNAMKRLFTSGLGIGLDVLQKEDGPVGPLQKPLQRLLRHPFVIVGEIDRRP